METLSRHSTNFANSSSSPAKPSMSSAERRSLIVPPPMLPVEVFDDSVKVGSDVVLLHGCPQRCMPNLVEYLLYV